jgi:hypothetical protein
MLSMLGIVQAFCSGPGKRQTGRLFLTVGVAGFQKRRKQSTSGVKLDQTTDGWDRITFQNLRRRDWVARPLQPSAVALSSVLASVAQVFRGPCEGDCERILPGDLPCKAAEHSVTSSLVKNCVGTAISHLLMADYRLPFFPETTMSINKALPGF